MSRKRKTEEIIPNPLSGIDSCPSYSEDELEFLKAMERYRRERKRPFPTCCEVLAVLKSLGYRKVGETIEIPRYGANGIVSSSTKE